MKIGNLEKITSTHQNLRTPTMEGVFEEFPKVGETFKIYGEGLKFGNRIIHTSTVVEILEEKKDYMIFKTLNSTYRVNLLSDGDTDFLEYLNSCQNMGTLQ